MQRAIVASIRTTGALALFLVMSMHLARAVPPLANGQGLSCQSCHTSFPGMTAYGMATMMSNFQNLNWRKQHQALPLALRLQITSFLSNKDQPGRTTTKTMSLFAAGFLGRNFTYYAEQPIVDTGQPGITEQIWLSWNGLFGGSNSLQAGKYHTPFPFMPAHGWTMSDYLLARQDSGQNAFEPADSHWGIAFNGMSNEFMYNLAYLAGNGPIQHAFDYNHTDNPRAFDANISYGGMTKPFTIGLVAMRGAWPLRDGAQAFAGDDWFTRQGAYYSYQSRKWLLQTMYYRGDDSQPDVGAGAGALHGFMFEAQRDFGWKDHVLARYDVASSDTLNRQYVLSYAHHFLPNMKLTSELMMSPGHRPQIGFAVDWAGPFQAGQRFLWKAPVGAYLAPAQIQSASTAVAAATLAATPAPASLPPPPTTAAGDANAGAKLVQNNGCMGCHGAKFQGGIGPKLFGIEHQLAPAQIADFIKHPRSPMPDFGFSDGQIADIVTYLSSLDGGGGVAGAPTITLTPDKPTERAMITVRFPGSHPAQVTARAIMQMGTGSHHLDVVLHQTSDPHVWQGEVEFSMGGPWTIQIRYDDKQIDIPLQVGQ